MMENEERYTSYAAAAGSKSTTGHVTEAVLDSWEEAAQDGVGSQELERSIEQKLGKMKQKNNMKPVAPASSNHLKGSALDDGSYSASSKTEAGESASSTDLTTAGAPVIRILKRPQSSGHLPQQSANKPSGTMTEQSNLAARELPPIDGRHARNGNAGRSNQLQRTLEERAAAYAEARMRIFGVADQQIHDDLPVPPNLSTVPRSNQSSPGSNSNR